MSTEKEESVYFYMIFLSHSQPMNTLSTVDLIEQWQDQIEKRRKSNDWITPITFTQEDGTVIASFAPGAILGVVKGMPAPKVKGSE